MKTQSSEDKLESFKMPFYPIVHFFKWIKVSVTDFSLLWVVGVTIIHYFPEESMSNMVTVEYL